MNPAQRPPSTASQRKLARVYVRGVGAITALGTDWPSSLARLAAGESAICRIDASLFDASDFPCQVAAPISPDKYQPEHTAHAEPNNRRLYFASQAAAQAWRQADLATELHNTPAKRIGVFIGAEAGRASFATVHALTRAAGGGQEFNHQEFARNAKIFTSQLSAAQTSPAAVANLLARQSGASGPVATISLACASSAAAIAEAWRAITAGECDLALCGGVGADIDPLMLAGFGKLGALSARGISCPFDLRRDGFVVGEGAAMLVLSRHKGQAKVEILGQARSLDAFHLTAPEPNGAGAERAMRAALAQAGLSHVDYVQAHGTSTALNDAIEAQALGRVMDDKLADCHVSSIKGALGHWIAGAGALGFLAAHAAIAEGILLPTANLQQPDPACALPHILHQAKRHACNTAMVNAFAFGGANCSIVLAACA